jgi:hypothetical protein
LAKPNFQFEKRQKELEKKRKNEEKLKRKLEKHTGQPGNDQIDGNLEQPAADPINPA